MPMQQRRAMNRRALPSALMAASMAAAIAALLCALWLASAHANDADDQRADWVTYWQQTMRSLKASKQEASSDLIAVREQLAQAELDIAATTRQIRKNHARIAALQSRLGDFTRQRRALDAQLATQRRAVTQQVIGLWQTGSEGRLKLLLSQQSVNALSRMLVYYDYLNRARGQLIDGYRDSLRQVARVIADIAATQAALDQEQAAMLHSETLLRSYQRKREQQRQSLQQTIRDRSLELKHARHALERVVDAQRGGPQRGGGQRGEQRAPFASRTGRMLWPAYGPFTNHFNDDTPFSGMTIASTEGAPVTAVAPGTVAFVSWIEHYGVLLMLSHDEGYLSIYAHNQSVLCEVGERVGEGQVIATAGKSGGIAEAALYFELRHNEQPLNVARWLAKH